MDGPIRLPTGVLGTTHDLLQQDYIVQSSEDAELTDEGLQFWGRSPKRSYYLKNHKLPLQFPRKAAQSVPATKSLSRPSDSPIPGQKYVNKIKHRRAYVKLIIEDDELSTAALRFPNAPQS